MSTATARLSTAEFLGLDLGEGSRRDYLWDGEIVRVMPPDPPHSWTVTEFADLLRDLFPRDAYRVKSEQPLDLRDGYQPQPDIMVLRGTAATLGLRNATPGDLELLVEVSDSTLALDTGKKRSEYAGQAIDPYWVADVQGRRLLVFTDPEPATGNYAKLVEYGRGDRVPIRGTTIAIDEIFRHLDGRRDE